MNNLERAWQQIVDTLLEMEDAERTEAFKQIPVWLREIQEEIRRIEAEGCEDDEPYDSQGSMHEASEEDFEKWAEAYDDLNGGPENDEDR